MNNINVLVVDDSAVVRQVMSEMLSSDPNIHVIAAVADPLFALERMKSKWPDVIVTDVEMPRMDGVSFVRKVMSEKPTPIVVCSSLTEKGAETTMQVLAAGAVHVVTKPRMNVKAFLQESTDNLIEAVKAAARARVKRLRCESKQPPRATTRHSVDTVLPPPDSAAMVRTTERIVAIGTSTGGTQALEVVLSSLPRISPGLVIVQHMPEQFTAAFANRLNGLCEIEVREAESNDRVIPGRALIAPGGKHMVLKRSGAQYHVAVIDGPLVNRHRPSVDVLFRSVAGAAGANALGIIMTGMGDDGARGLRDMRNARAHTIAQDEDSCVVYGMPKEAVRLDAVNDIVPLTEIAAAIQGFGSLNRL